MAEVKKDWIYKLGRLDRRIIFFLIFLAVALPLLLNLVLPVHTSPIVDRLFDKIESLPPGSKVLLSLDYGPATAPENQPMAESMARHALERDLKLYIMSLWATGPGQAVLLIDMLGREFPDKVQGEDWVNIGYKAGNQGLINAILLDMKAMYTTDVNGTSVDDIPMMADVENLTDMHLIAGIGSGFPGLKEWVQFAGDRGDIPVGGGVTAVEAPLLYPYYPSQLLGLMGGLQGAAEYEAALIRTYPKFKETAVNAVELMGPQAVAHTVIVLFVLIGNITFFIERRRERKI
ncbi:MAG: hypothetical protein KJ970_09810 [Candidatus Eisenbacteria bacterium]|uniref:Uncharacterized protein n=1 Tax=Eiseniibacteriota bacterium TaxID=2212470 RepID=A0A948RX84_UNCEI|nr:hypothetical protein [Candidatus Eisenbacteria bacterium]MBU1947167.1 hypothetical protein [Candidatus Eisenbacteria bacterium]MBU2691213.1 hypothetical protein [Candidatus Eisenbacteria bacterium]